MLYTISNQALNVTVNSKGGELWSIKSPITEYLWQGDETYWGDRSPNLFPICCRLWDGKYIYDNNTYEMDIHGFAQYSEMEAVMENENSVKLSFKQNEQTLKKYPFKFIYSITYTLQDNKITVEYCVQNTDDKDIFFSVGAHPGFNVPFDGGDFDDYVLEFCVDSGIKALGLSKECFVTDSYVLLPLEQGKIIPLTHSMFDNDALVLADCGEKVKLYRKDGEKSIVVTYPNMPYLGLWHAKKTKAPYICIEPWVGLPSKHGVVDKLESKINITKLEPNKQYSVYYTIEINE